MSQSADIQPYSIAEILEILQSEAKSMPPSPTSVRYLRALESLRASVCAHAGIQAPGAAPSETGNRKTDNAQKSDDTALDADTHNDNSSLIINNLSLSLTDWLVNQWLMNIPFSSASLYLDIISSLYGSAVKAGRLPKATLFSQLKSQLKALGPKGWKSGIDDEIFDRALRLTKNAAHLISDDAIAADLVLLSLTHSLQPLDRIALLKREDIMEDGKETDSKEQILPGAYCEADTYRQILSVIFNNLSLGGGRRKYVFPLRQSTLTPAQLNKRIAKIVNALFKRVRLPQATDPNQTVEALWAYAALRAGIPASQLVAYLGHAPLGLPVLKLSVMGNGHSDRQTVGLIARDVVNGSAVSNRSESSDGSHGQFGPHENAKRKTENANLAQVGKIFLDNPPRWYAMSLRPGVRFTQVCRRIQLLSKPHTAHSADTSLPDIQLFYPCEEIARAIGKKIVIKQRPFIHSVVFFRARLTDIGRLFAKIGDLAWCYRQSARPGAPYADISQRQFERFQQTIARFTPDYEVASTGELELKKNDRVQILGGLFAGHEATFDSVGKAEEGVVYRLSIVGDNGFDWRIAVDKRLAHHKN